MYKNGSYTNQGGEEFAVQMYLDWREAAEWFLSPYNSSFGATLYFAGATIKLVDVLKRVDREMREDPLYKTWIVKNRLAAAVETSCAAAAFAELSDDHAKRFAEGVFFHEPSGSTAINVLDVFGKPADNPMGRNGADLCYIVKRITQSLYYLGFFGPLEGRGLRKAGNNSTNFYKAVVEKIEQHAVASKTAARPFPVVGHNPAGLLRAGFGTA